MTTQSLQSPEIEPDGVRPELERSAGAAQSPRKIRLGEELPIFCEKCGYALHGLAQAVCEQCTIRQFHCPECGHHQPINTLRPAAQKMLGRLRAFFLALSVFIKLNFFGWLLVAWVSIGYSEAYRYDMQSYYANAQVMQSGARRYNGPTLKVRSLESDEVVAFCVFGFFYGAIGRMLLLRWRRGYLVGLILGGLVFLAIGLGAIWRQAQYVSRESLPNPLAGDFLFYMMISALALLLGASVVWGIWSALVFMFLPKRTGAALLEWQSSMSNESGAAIGRG
jgi:hypothetical protein